MSTRQNDKQMPSMLKDYGITVEELDATIDKYGPIVNELGVLKDATSHQEMYFYARLCLHDRKLKILGGERHVEMRFRDFFRITQLAMHGRRVAVSRFDERDARRVLREYVDNLKSYGVKGWNARWASGVNEVAFDGGGWVRFMSSSRQLFGVDIIYDTDDDISEYLR